MALRTTAASPKSMVPTISNLAASNCGCGTDVASRTTAGAMTAAAAVGTNSASNRCAIVCTGPNDFSNHSGETEKSDEHCQYEDSI